MLSDDCVLPATEEEACEAGSITAGAKTIIGLLVATILAANWLLSN